MKISDAVFLSYLRCPYKAFLLLEGRTGQRSDYETMLDELDNRYKPLAQAALYHWSASAAVATGPAEDDFFYNGREPITLDAMVEYGSFELVLDALKPETDGPRGGPRNLPMAYCSTDRISRLEELRLAFGAQVLGLVQASVPSTGIVVHGAKCSLTTVRLKDAFAESLVNEPGFRPADGRRSSPSSLCDLLQTSFPEMSTFYCHPGEAGGSPVEV
jgi:hypothetical protein